MYWSVDVNFVLERVRVARYCVMNICCVHCTLHYFLVRGLVLSKRPCLFLLRCSLLSAPGCHCLWAWCFLCDTNCLFPAAFGYPWRAEGAVTCPLSQQQHPEHRHPDSLCPGAQQQLQQSLTMCLSLLPSWISGWESLFNRRFALWPW